MFQDRKSFCDAIDLLLESELHRNFYLKDLERLVFPALRNKRMVLFYNDVGAIEGLYSHTFLTDVAQQGYLDGTRKLQPSDWRDTVYALSRRRIATPVSPLWSTRASRAHDHR